MVGIDRDWGPSRRVGLTLHDPRRRMQQLAPRPQASLRSAAASRGQATQRPQQPQRQQQSGSTGNPFADNALNLLASGSTPSDDGGGKGLGEEFFGTTIGKGLGAVLNNPVVKNVLKPLDVLGVPGRAVVSTIQETKDAVLDGEGFSPQDWYNQINPFQAIHGENAEDSIGFGDIVADAGGTGNRYADAALGFLGDVVTDPLTYVAGLGVADKAFDAGRMGSKFASKANAAKAASTTRSLTGKGTRLERVAAANQKLNSGVFDRATKVQIDAAKDELQKVGVRGLSYKSPGLDTDVSRLVRDALGTGDAGLRFRGGIPFVPQGKFNVQVPGTQRPAQALSNAMGKVRAGRNESALGQRAIGYTAPVDLENASRVILGGAPGPEGVDAARAFDLATETVESIARERPAAGRYLNDGQRAINKQRKGIKREIKQKFGGDSEAYIAHAEKNGGTQLNELFDYLGGDLANRFGVTVPNLGGDLNYVGHVWNPQFLRKVSRNKAMQDKFNARYGAAGPDLLKESGRMEKRSYKINEGQTVAEVNAELAAEFPEISGKALQTDPIRILDDYVQAVSEDVGRRAGRADMNAAGSGNLQYDIGKVFNNPKRRAEELEKNVRAWEAQNGKPADDGIRTMLGEQVDQAFSRESKKQIKESAIERTMAERRKNGTFNNDDPAVDYRELSEEYDGPNYEPVDLAIIAQPEMADQIRARLTAGPEAAKEIDEMFNRWIGESGNTHMLLDPQFNAMRQNLLREIVNAGLPGRTFNKLTNFFKTYATLTPGFHVRNGMSALFMNAADGVPFVTSLRGIDLWGDYERAFRKAMKDFPDDPARQIRAGDAWYNQQEKGVQKAFDAVVGSGAGGRFAESGFAEGVGKYTGKITENAATRFSQRVGASVEGRARMGMALDSIGKGASVQDAIDRITRVQFDYSQVSRLDAGAKRFFPFWSFMSRNLPLQLMQQWSRPAMYSNYEHLKDNFAQPEALAGLDGEVPDYIQDGGGMPFDLGPFNWLEPDLPHTRLNEDLEALSEIGSNPARMLSNLNPVISAPLEYTFGKDAYTGRTYEETDIRPINWLSPNDLMAIVPGALLGGNLTQADDGTWFITEKLANSVGALSPATSRADRIVGGAGGERGWETVGRNFGLPVRTITQTQIDNQEKSRYFDELERREIERILGNARFPPPVTPEG